MHTRIKKWLGRLSRFIRLSFREFLEVRCSDKAAALAFYAAFSMAPLLVIAVAIASLVFGRAAADGELMQQLQRMMGEKLAETLHKMAVETADLGSGILATVIGVCILLWGASKAFKYLQTSLAEIWGIDSEDKGWKKSASEYVRSVVLVAGAGFFLLGMLFISTATATLADVLSEKTQFHAGLLKTLNYVLAFMVFTGSFATVFRYLSRKSLTWRDVIAGSIMTSVMFVFGEWVIQLYLNYSSSKSALGAAGAFAVFLLWLDYMAQIVLLGAVMTHVYAREFGSYSTKSTEKHVETLEMPDVI